MLSGIASLVQGLGCHTVSPNRDSGAWMTASCLQDGKIFSRDIPNFPNPCWVHVLHVPTFASWTSETLRALSWGEDLDHMGVPLCWNQSSPKLSPPQRLQYGSNWVLPISWSLSIWVSPFIRQFRPCRLICTRNPEVSRISDLFTQVTFIFCLQLRAPRSGSEDMSLWKVPSFFVMSWIVAQSLELDMIQACMLTSKIHDVMFLSRWKFALWQSDW